MSEAIINRHYEGLRVGELHAHRCRRCHRITFPMTGECDECGSFDYDEVSLRPLGSLVSAAHGASLPPHPRFRRTTPYVYGQIRLDDGVLAEAIIRGVEATPEAVARLGAVLPAPVVLDVLESEGLPIMAFRLAGTAHAL